MSGPEIFRIIAGIFALFFTTAMIALARYLTRMAFRVAKIEWQLEQMAKDAIKAITNPRAETGTLKELLKKVEEGKQSRTELREVTAILSGMLNSRETSREDKTLASLILRDIERRYTL